MSNITIPSVEYIVIGFAPEVKKCVYCVNAKRLLEQRGKSHAVYNEHTDEAKLLLSRLHVEYDGIAPSQIETYPVIYKIGEGGHYVGGFTDLMNQLNK